MTKINKTAMRISILGAGKIGQAVAQLWVRAGHSICFGARFPEKLTAIVETLGTRASAKSIQKAAAESEIILLAVPYEAVDQLAISVTNELAGKIVLDATNPIAFSPEGRLISALGPHCTAGSRLALLLPKSTVIRAFTHVMDELLVSRGTSQTGFWAMAIAGDVPAAKLLAAGLVRDTGFVPVDIGTLAESEPLDPGGVLFPHMFNEADMRAKLKS